MKPLLVNRFALKAALADLDAKGIEVGDHVCVTWKVPENYGGQTRSHTGRLSELDRATGRYEILESAKSPGHLRSTITSLNAVMVKVEESVKTDSKPSTTSNNPFIKKAAKRNPFIEKAKKS